MTSRDARRGTKSNSAGRQFFVSEFFQACASGGCLFQRASAACLALSERCSGVSDRRERLPRLTAFGFFLFRVFERLDIRDIVQSRAPVAYRQKRANGSDQIMRTLEFQKSLDSRLSALYLEAGTREPAAAWSDRAGGREG